MLYVQILSASSNISVCMFLRRDIVFSGQNKNMLNIFSFRIIFRIDNLWTLFFGVSSYTFVCVKTVSIA